MANANSAKLHRRDVLKFAGAGMGLAGLPPIGTRHVRADESDTSQNYGLPSNWRKIPKIDAHNHVFSDLSQPDADWSTVESLVEASEILGIDQMCCSQPITGGKLAGIDEVRLANNSVLAAMKRYPDRIRGYCFLQPGNGPACIDELKRCLNEGMIGVKLYNQYKYTNPLVFPIIEHCIQQRVPVLGHSAHLTDPKSIAAQPNTSDSLDFCQLAGRYPEAMLILGHINGGGDWEWAIKGLRGCENVWLDTSGSNMDNDTIGKCVRELGIHRILFATDTSMEGGVGKILSANLTEEQRSTIFSRNMTSILAKRV